MSPVRSSHTVGGAACIAELCPGQKLPVYWRLIDPLREVSIHIMPGRVCLALLGLLASVLCGVLGMNFTCERPTTPCDGWYGTCQPDGRCACNSGAMGLQCQISGSVKRNGGNCQMQNPCEVSSSTCYDDGVVAKCDCNEGFYGVKCTQPMVTAECDEQKMIINVYPYGFSNQWSYPPPLTGDNFTCPLQTMSDFLTKHPAYLDRRWEGFAAVFTHSGDTCAGPSTVLSATARTTTYARTVYISYSSTGPHATDQTIEVSCDVTRGQPTPPPVVFPRPTVRVEFRTPTRTPVRGPLKLGARVHVYFTLNIPNNGGYDDAQVDTCTLRDNVYQRNVVIVDAGCAQAPVGELLYKRGPGMAVLIMRVHKFPGMSGRLSFQCRVRVCNKNLDNWCSTPVPCHLRGRRSAGHLTSARDDNVITVEETITV